MAEYNKIPLVVIAGPTASGKTKLAVDICKKLNGEVVSADSMQIYKGMNIATAKPTLDEMHGIKHHMIDFLETDKKYSVAQYCEQATKCIEKIHQKGKLPVLAGGTGLYINSLVENIQFVESKTDYSLREKLREKADSQGAQVLLDELDKIDKETARNLHPNNLGRIIRALEIYYTTGITMSEQLEKSRRHPSPYNVCMLFLTFKDRQVLYDRINKRVDIMLEKGLVEEARGFIQLSSKNTARQAIGYKELVPYFNDGASLEDCTEKLKRETRRYAKRQLTWFNRNPDMKKIYVDEMTEYDYKEILDESIEVILKTLN
ncbi:MAG TPA: tRNA (adenosine(37)-N6)-dimethylallyltransferase MiaA [Clostridia bacterium]|nr:tRNA (adenosine(37)-N6)-dimethylallyltransferase MiaA [Clostridia bacterium]